MHGKGTRIYVNVSFLRLLKSSVEKFACIGVPVPVIDSPSHIWCLIAARMTVTLSDALQQ